MAFCWALSKQQDKGCYSWCMQLVYGEKRWQQVSMEYLGSPLQPFDQNGLQKRKSSAEKWLFMKPGIFLCRVCKALTMNNGDPVVAFVNYRFIV